MKFTKPKTEKKPYVNCRHIHTQAEIEAEAEAEEETVAARAPSVSFGSFFWHTHNDMSSAKCKNTHTHTHTMKERTVSWQRIKWQTAECRAQSRGTFAAPSSFPFAAPTTSALCWNNHKIKISYWICWTGRQSISTFAYTVSTPTPLPPPLPFAASFVS